MNKTTNKIMSTIRECGEFLSWLHKEEGIYIKDMPEKFKPACIQLQKLGIVYKRNNRNLGIKWIRLRRLIERSGSTVPYDRKKLIDFFSEPVPSAF